MENTELEIIDNNNEVKPKSEKFSYSKVGVFEGCKYKYKLIYVDKHFINDSSIATDFGTLIHYIEETMANKICKNEPLNSSELIHLLYNADINNPTEVVKGVNLLKKEYPEDWMQLDKSDRTYADKVDDYCNNGIFRLYSYLKNNPNLEIVGIEQEFNVLFNGYIFHGFIDRVFRDKTTGHIYIEDIKTWNKPAKEEDLKTPLQFVLYSLAAQELYNVTEDQISCAYELPLCDVKQEAGSKGFMKRGIKKLTKLLEEIESGDFAPNPSPLCHWCVFSPTKPNQPKEAEGLCPYYCHWTKDNKTMDCENPWMGPEQHDVILESFRKKLEERKEIILRQQECLNLMENITFSKAEPTENSNRIFLIRTK